MGIVPTDRYNSELRLSERLSARQIRVIFLEVSSCELFLHQLYRRVASICGKTKAGKRIVTVDKLPIIGIGRHLHGIGSFASSSVPSEELAVTIAARPSGVGVTCSNELLDLLRRPRVWDEGRGTKFSRDGLNCCAVVAIGG
jgi:hypothetical protein